MNSFTTTALTLYLFTTLALAAPARSSPPPTLTINIVTRTTIAHLHSTYIPPVCKFDSAKGEDTCPGRVETETGDVAMDGVTNGAADWDKC